MGEKEREQVWNSISLPSSLSWLICLPLSLSLVGVRLSIHLGNCGSALLEASSLPSQGQQPGGDAQEPALQDCQASSGPSD